MDGPWLKYQSSPAPAEGPWSKYQTADVGAVEAAMPAQESGLQPLTSPVQAALDPITNWPTVQAEKAHAAADMVAGGVDKVVNGEGIGTKALGVGQAALGALGYVTSPISATVKSFFGNPVERTTGIPADIAGLPVELALPGVGMSRMPAIAGANVPANFVAPASRAARTAAAFERSNVSPSIPAVVENRGVGTAAKVVGDTVVGSPVTRATEDQFRQAGQQAGRIADTISDVGDKATAGERIQAGAQRFVEETAPARQNELYDRARDLIQPQNSNRPPPVSNLGATTRAIRGVEGIIDDPGVRAFVTDPNFVRLAETIRDAAQRGGLSFDTLRELRSQVRALRPAEGSATGINRGAVNRIYDGLTEDMTALARQAGGPEGELALRRADQYTRALEATRRPALQKILDARSGEDVFSTVERLAGSGASADWRRMMQIRQSVMPQEWNDIAATVIRNLGTPKAGNTGVEATRGIAAEAGFSPAEFMTRYAAMSERGRNMLFGGQTELRRALDDLATVSSNLKRVERLGNPSGSGRFVQAGAVGAGLVNPSTTVPTVAALLTGRAGAYILSSPAAVRWLTATQRALQSGSQQAIAFQRQRIPAVAAGDSEIASALKSLFEGRAPSPAYADGEAQSDTGR